MDADHCIYSTIKESRGGESNIVVGGRTCNPEVQGSNPPPCHWMDLSLVAPNLTPLRFVNSQLVCILPVGILNKFMLIYDICLFTYSVSISTAVLNTLTLK